MKFLKIFATAATVLPITSVAASFSESLEKLSVSNPEFVAYADFQGDFQAAGSFLTDAYLAYLMTSPDIPPIPVDFNRLFEHLGFSAMQSATAVSEAREGGGFVNQAIIEFSSPPSGLFVLSGDSNQPFDIVKTAPADADFIAEMNLNGVALYKILRAMVIDIMGPMGEGMIDSQMNKPVVPDGPTIAEIISRLTTRLQVAAKPEIGVGGSTNPGLALLQGKAAIRIANIADMLDSLGPLLQQAGFSASAGGETPRYTATIPLQADGLIIHLSGIAGSNDLLVSFNEESEGWFLEGSGSIAESESFQKETAGLPTEGLSFWYATTEMAELQIQQLDAQVEGNEKMLPLITALKSFLMNYTGPQAGVSFLEDNAYRVISYQPTSYKTNIAIAGAIIPISFASSFAAVAQAQAAQAEETDPSPAE